ncbi:hypothetical protein PPROV_000468400 [Pycnococcus provasolii]|uniref:AB hydrolase-1 domain-containing protein n=1 Tax=Pycnococcus provasolii TaxID=41880 RepID=A0A830HLM9_9CHLO|nr:hypothetical protein PPROV_000468400 [Pycnococcus provasolii]
MGLASGSGWMSAATYASLALVLHRLVAPRFLRRGWVVSSAVHATYLASALGLRDMDGDEGGLTASERASVLASCAATSGLAAAAMACWHKALGVIVFPAQVWACVGRLDRGGVLWRALPQAIRSVAIVSPDALRPHARKRLVQFNSVLGVRSREVRIRVPGDDASCLHGAVLLPPGELSPSAPVAVVLQGNAGCWEHELAFGANSLVPFLRCGCAVLLYNPRAVGGPDDTPGSHRPFATRDNLVADCLVAANAAATSLPCSLATEASAESAPAWLGFDGVGGETPPSRSVILCGHSLGGAVASAAAAACARAGDDGAPWLTRATVPAVTAVCVSRSFDQLTGIAGNWINAMAGLPDSVSRPLALALVGALGGWDLSPRRDLARASSRLTHAWVEYHPRDNVCSKPYQLDDVPHASFTGNFIELTIGAKGDSDPHNRELTAEELELRLAQVVRWREKSLISSGADVGTT